MAYKGCNTKENDIVYTCPVVTIFSAGKQSFEGKLQAKNSGSCFKTITSVGLSVATGKPRSPLRVSTTLVKIRVSKPMTTQISLGRRSRSHTTNEGGSRMNSGLKNAHMAEIHLLPGEDMPSDEGSDSDDLVDVRFQTKQINWSPALSRTLSSTSV